MGKRPNLDGIIKKLQKGDDFELTREQYINMTGIDIPQRKSYTEKNSSVAKKAAEYGFKIEIIPEKMRFKLDGDKNV